MILPEKCLSQQIFIQQIQLVTKYIKNENNMQSIQYVDVVLNALYNFKKTSAFSYN